MRNFALAGLAAALALVPAAGSAQNRPAPARPPIRPAQPAPQTQQSQIPQAAGLIVLIKSSLTALNHANQTGNYQVLYALGSDGLRAQTNPQTLAQSFAPFRERRIDLSPILFMDPQLARQPTIEGGRLHLVGSFPTTPLKITFDFWFEPSQGQWKFIQLNTNLVPATPTPPQPPQRR